MVSPKDVFSPFTLSIKVLFKLYLRVGIKKAYYVCATISDIEKKIPQLVQATKKYINIMNQLSELGKEGFSSGESDYIKNFQWNK